MIAKRVTGVGVPHMHGVFCRRILILSVPQDSPYRLDLGQKICINDKYSMRVSLIYLLHLKLPLI